MVIKQKIVSHLPNLARHIQICHQPPAFGTGDLWTKIEIQDCSWAKEVEDRWWDWQAQITT